MKSDPLDDFAGLSYWQIMSMAHKLKTGEWGEESTEKERRAIVKKCIIAAEWAIKDFANHLEEMREYHKKAAKSLRTAAVRPRHP